MKLIIFLAPIRHVRATTRSNFDTRASFLLNLLNWDDLLTRRQKLKATLMFKTIKELTPAYIQNFFSIRSTQFNLRDWEAKLELPMPRTNYSKRAFCYRGALLWNNYFSISLRKSDSIGYLKGKLTISI